MGASLSQIQSAISPFNPFRDPPSYAAPTTFDFECQLLADTRSYSVLLESAQADASAWSSPAVVPSSSASADDAESRVLRNAACAAQGRLSTCLFEDSAGGETPVRTIWEGLQRAVRKYPDAPYIGIRVFLDGDTSQSSPLSASSRSGGEPIQHGRGSTPCLGPNSSGQRTPSPCPSLLSVTPVPSDPGAVSSPPVSKPSKQALPRGDFHFHTYAEAQTRVHNLAAGLHVLGSMAPRSFVGIWSINRPEWVLAQYAAFSRSCPVVALYSTLSDSNVSYVIEHSGVSVVFVEELSVQRLLALCEKGQCGVVRTVVMLQHVPAINCNTEHVNASTVARFAKCGVQFFGMLAVEEEGAKHIAEHAEYCDTPPSPEDIAFLMYTSGTTGAPKGVLLSHRGIMAAACITTPLVLPPASPADRYLSYLPLAHVLECTVQAICTAFGVCIGFYSGDTGALTADMERLRPTVLAGVPRVFTKMHQRIVDTVRTKPFHVRTLFDLALAVQSRALRNQQPINAWLDSLVFAPIRARAGLDQLRLVLIGSAPLAPWMLEFLRILLGGRVVVEGYGSTECSAVVTLAMPGDHTAGHVGPPNLGVEIKLRDVPDMNYRHTDVPCPRGEVLLRGPQLCKGYHKDAQATQECLVAGGWWATGDVARLNPNGTLTIIDRRKNVFKLAQGEFVAAEVVERVYGACPLVNQIWVTGNAFRSFTVAVVVPQAEPLRDIATEKGWWNFNSSISADKAAFARALGTIITGPHAADLKNVVLNSMRQYDGGLKGYEKVRDIILEGRLDAQFNGFSEANELLTPTFKLRRPQLNERYVKQLKELYAANGEPPQPHEIWPGEKKIASSL